MIEQWNDNHTGWALFSEDMKMRYRLARSLVDDRRLIRSDGTVISEIRASGMDFPMRVVFLMLNPSTADAFDDDRTVAKCSLFARSWGAHIIEVVNLFALRSTDPSALRKCAAGYRGDDASNNAAITAGACRGAAFVIGAYGKHGLLGERCFHVHAMLRDFFAAHPGSRPMFRCLGTNNDGTPRHPLYLKNDTQLQEWNP